MATKEKHGAKKIPVKKGKRLNKEFPGYSKYKVDEDFFIKRKRVDKNLQEDLPPINPNENDSSISKTKIDSTDLNTNESKITNENLERWDQQI